MNLRKNYISLIGLALVLSITAGAQDNNQVAIESITAAELTDHIFFLASDYLKGRVAATPEYEIAANYVAAQFAAAGLQPVVEDEYGNMGYLQGVPFARTVFNDEVKWGLSIDGKEKELVHKKDFKILMELLP